MSSTVQKCDIKFEELCRTCLSKDIEVHSVFDVVSGTLTLDSVITTITGVKIEVGDGLPATVCRDCKEKAASAFQFKARALEADAALRAPLKVEKCEEPPPEPPLFEKPVLDVKSEEIPVTADLSNDHDDFLDIDFNLPLTNGEHTLKDLSLECKDTSSTYCPLCGTSYEDAVDLTRHMWEVHADLMGPKKRGRPKKLLTSTILSKLSENGHSLDKKYSCILCNEDLKTKEDLAMHMMEHRDEKLLSCLVCKKTFLKKNDFDRHNCLQNRMDMEHLQENQPPEGQVEQKQVNFPAETLLQDLLVANNQTVCGGVVEVCRWCGCVYRSSAELAEHLDREHPDQSLRCGHCHKCFASVKSASRHRAVCARVERSFACSTCGQRFAHEISLNKHILRTHAGQSVSVRFMDPRHAHRCDVCRRSFGRKDLLVKHAKIHKPGEKNFECDICKKKFNRRNNLRSHMRTHETPAQKSNASSACLCLYCGRGFSNSSNLIVHMRRHTGEKPYKCDFCDKGFPRSSDLQCHRRSHTGEKPCVCGVCGKGFSRSNKLSRHMRVHTGLKPYKCSYCDKAFSQSNDLTLHVRRHTGDKPYVCELCGDRFIQGTALHNHRRSHGHFPGAGLSVPGAQAQVNLEASAPATAPASAPAPTLAYTVQSGPPAS